MKPFSVHPIVKEGFSLAARQEGSTIFVKISGNGDMETPATLGVYLKKVHGEATRLRASSVVVECDELYFMSSACVKCLVTWIDGVLKLPPENRYKVKFRANANLPWQRRSFEALRRFAPALVHIESDSAPRTPIAHRETPNASGEPSPASATPQSASTLESSPQTPAARRKS